MTCDAFYFGMLHEMYDSYNRAFGDLSNTEKEISYLQNGLTVKYLSELKFLFAMQQCTMTVQT